METHTLLFSAYIVLCFTKTVLCCVSRIVCCVCRYGSPYVPDPERKKKKNKTKNKTKHVGYKIFAIRVNLMLPPGEII